MERKCCVCGNEINVCMGYVLARDFVAYLKRETGIVREICGKDILRNDLGKINLEDSIK